MENDILLSFIIPMYNAEKYIGNCLDSILLQDLDEKNYEILVVDDGSTDNGKRIVDGYSVVKYVRQDNQGQSAARNRGIELARGKYLCFVDADDSLVPLSIKFCLDVAIEKNLDMVTYDVIRCTEETVSRLHPQINNSVDDVFTGKEYIEKYNFNNGPWLYLIRKQSLGEQRFVLNRYGEDGMFTIELLLNVDRVAHINNQCYYYYERPGSTTTKKDKSHLKKVIEDYLFVYHYIQGLIKKNEKDLSPGAISRLQTRSESYVFFLLVRLLRFPDTTVIKPSINSLKKEGLYPVKRPYPGVKFAITSFVVNNPILLRLCNWILSYK